MYKIRLENTITHQIYEQMVEDTNEGNKLFFRFGISTFDLADGEHILTVFDEDGNVVAEDLLRIGNFTPDALQYAKGESTYLDVSVEGLIQKEVNVVLDTVNGRGIPDLGYDAVETVWINAQPLYDSARAEGYDEGYGIGFSESYPKGYDDGYDKGTEEGYNAGYELGVTEQKGKLTSIKINENGTYIREDGYDRIEVDVQNDDGVYDEGYADGYEDGLEEGISNAGSVIAETARVLEITENGKYYSEYSEIEWNEPTTGIFNDGTEFKSYATLSNAVYDTGILADKNSKIEIWWKDASEKATMYAPMFGAQTSEGYIYKICEYSRGMYRFEYGDNGIGTLFTKNFNYDMISQWNHITFHKDEGLYINGELICTVPEIRWRENITVPNFWINSAYIDQIKYNPNGQYGMIKIDDTIIIPTDDGFLNTSTNELLTTLVNGAYVFTVPEKPKGEGNLIKTVTVNVLPKINVAKEGLKFSYSNFTEVPEWLDWEGITDMSYMFSYSKLQKMPFIDTSNVVSFNYAFRNSELIEMPLLNTSNGTDFTYCFCASQIEELPQLDLSKAQNLYEFCYQCGKLKYVPNLDLSSATNINGLIENCNSLISVGEIKVPSVRGNVTYFLGNSNKNNLTDFGGLIGFRGSITSSGFHTCPNLSYQSCINILNGLYDFVGNGETPSSDEGKLKVHQNFLNLVGDEISIGTNKGWTITA